MNAFAAPVLVKLLMNFLTVKQEPAAQLQLHVEAAELGAMGEKFVAVSPLQLHLDRSL